MNENKGPFTTESEDPLNQEICNAANDMVTGGDGPTPGEIMAWKFAKEGDLCPHCEGFGSKSKETSRPCPLCKGERQKK